MHFNDIEKFAISTANLTFATSKEKEKIKNMIIGMVVQGCIAYSKDVEFKKHVDGRKIAMMFNQK